MSTRYEYQAEVSHKGLNKYQIVKAATPYELQCKKEAIMARWNEQWSKIVEREQRKKNDEDSENYAREATQKAQELQESLDRIVLSNLSPNELDLNGLKDHSTFQEQQPNPPRTKTIPQAPQRAEAKYNPRPTFMMKLSKKKRAEAEQENTTQFEKDFEKWNNEKHEIEENNRKLTEEYENELHEWQQRLAAFEEKQTSENRKVDYLYEQFKNGDKESVERYFQLLLERIQIPFNYSLSVETEYDAQGKVLIADIQLPSIDDIPKLKSVSFIKTKKEFKEQNYPDAYLKKKYDSVNYQIVLQVLNHIFTIGSKHNMIDSAVINGKIDTIDNATGKRIEPYILSVSVSKTDFENLDLQYVDPKAWFRSVKGVSAASLANNTPVAPIISMSREDSRFIDGYEVVNNLDDSINLAAIDWQDFENLVREVFEKEFNANGGEVKITQASRDGGVDAVAFDPDPIRGGKIVIQAKRYTNVVGVSAVRDLYGTVLNEGATKGILVTTSYFGSDAYSFAQGKPLTLMNGANLLYLLEKHGHKARIDLKEAKEALRS